MGALVSADVFELLPAIGQVRQKRAGILPGLLRLGAELSNA